jgi:hypothetical protein
MPKIRVFCIEALEEALSKNEKPEIFNTDQGSRLAINSFDCADQSSSAFLHNASKMELSTGVRCDS